MPESPGLDPALFKAPGMRVALAVRDISTVYRLLTEAGISQRTVAKLTGQSQSEVCEILKGRQVMGYDVLVRICTGLGIPRGAMGLAYDGAVTPAPVGEVDEEMRRRALLAAASVALFGAPVLGELLEIPVRPGAPTPLPVRLGSADVAAIRELTAQLRGVARTYGGCADTVTAVATRSRVLMSVPASEQTRSELGSALAELHTVAGWCCVDCGMHDHARANFATAMELAGSVSDGREVASAFRHAGIQMIDAGAYNDGLKAFQLGLMSAQDSETVAWLHGETAFPLAAMGERDAALSAMSRAREQPLSDPFDVADMDYVTSCVYHRLGRVDAARDLAASSVRKWNAEGTSHRDSVEASIMLATLHAEAGELDSVGLADCAITSVEQLRSTRARACLGRLTTALETRRDADFVELARRSRQVSAQLV